MRSKRSSPNKNVKMFIAHNFCTEYKSVCEQAFILSNTKNVISEFIFGNMVPDLEHLSGASAILDQPSPDANHRALLLWSHLRFILRLMFSPTHISGIMLLCIELLVIYHIFNCLMTARLWGGCTNTLLPEFTLPCTEISFRHNHVLLK